MNHSPIFKTNSNQTEYGYHKTIFTQNFSKLTHTEIKLDRIFRPGVTGYPVLDSFPFVFWKPAYIFHPGAHRQADRFFQQLYTSFILRCRVSIASDVEDDTLVALVLYAVWRYRTDWIYSLADLIREKRIKSKSCTATLKVACLLSCLQGEMIRADIVQRNITGEDKYFNYMYLLLVGKERISDKDETLPDEGQVSVKRLLWFDVAINGDTELEKTLLRKFTKNAPVDEDDLLDVYSALLTRGLLFRAQRLLFRHCQHLGEKPRLLYAILENYLINGKYLLFLRRLAKLEKIPFKHNWYLALYCIVSLSETEELESILNQLFGSKRSDQLPTDEVLMDHFKQISLAAQNGICPNPLNPESLYDLLMIRYLFSDARAERVKESFSTFERIVIHKIKRTYHFDVEQIALTFPALEDKYRLYEQKRPVQHIWPLLNGLAGRSLPIRMYLGLTASKHGYQTVAMTFFKRQVLQSVEQLHHQAELDLNNGDTDKAISCYQRIINLSPDSALFHYNYALVLEASDLLEQAVQMYTKVLALEPGFLPARDKLELLLT